MYDNVSAVESTSATRVNSSFPTDGAASQRNIDDLSQSLTSALTGGGKVQFGSPGEQQDFSDRVNDAVRNLMQGAEDARAAGQSPTENSQFQRGLRELVSALQGLLSTQQGDKAEGGNGAGGSQGAQGAGGAGGAEGAGGGEGDDLLKKLIALLRQMGMSDKDIAALLGKLGVPADQANQLIASAGEGEGGQAVGSASSSAWNPN